MRERVPVIHCCKVKASIISARSPGAVGLRDNVKGRRPSRLGWTDDPQIQHLLKLGLGRQQLVAGETSSACKDWRAGSWHRMPDTMGRQRVRVVVADEDAWKLVKDPLKDTGARAVETTEFDTSGRMSANHR